MRLKVISGIMLALFLVSTLRMVGTVLAPIPPSEGNINGDDRVDIGDIVRWARAFGSTPTSGNWDPAADIDGDNFVDIFDGVIIGINYGRVDP